MKVRRTYYLLAISVFLVQLIVSCETKQKLTVSKTPSVTKALNINFHENILELNPLRVTSQSEIFITELVFDRFYEPNGESSLIKHVYYDSIASKYVYLITGDKRFHDHTPVDSKAIKSFFKYLMRDHFDKAPIKLFFSSMTGFPLSNWYREERGILDSIPNGFQILNDSSFSIKMKNNSAHPNELMRAAEFTLFKKVDDQYIGSGPYELISLNEDISAKLERVEHAAVQIETINISFIKNNDFVFTEFLNGSLDLIDYHPLTILKTQKQRKLLNDKYPPYQVIKSNRSVLRYAQLNNLVDTTVLERIVNSTKTPVDAIHYIAYGQVHSKIIAPDSTDYFNNYDSIIHQISIQSDQLSSYEEYFLDSSSLKFVSIKKENINPSDQHIVIMETMLNTFEKNDKKSATLELFKRLKPDNYSAFLILDHFPGYVILSNRLRGIEEGQRLSSMIKSMYYITPKTY